MKAASGVHVQKANGRSAVLLAVAFIAVVVCFQVWAGLASEQSGAHAATPKGCVYPVQQAPIDTQPMHPNTDNAPVIVASPDVSSCR